MTLIGTQIAFAAELLKSGQVVAIPTETVYGLAANALDPVAVTQIFSIKNRPHFNPLIVHISSIQSAYKFVSQIPPQAITLAEKFMPGPLTLLLPRKSNIPDLVTAGSELVAIRVPAHQLTLNLLQLLPFPLAAPSANPFGYISPTLAEHVFEQLNGKIPYILDGGPCAIGVESTIIGFDKGKTIVYRHGGLSLEEIEDTIGQKVHFTVPASSNQPEAPGMLASHYAPRTKLVAGSIPDLLYKFRNKKTGILSFNRYYPTTPQEYQFVLSWSGNLDEAARNLFGAMRYLDSLGLDIIITEFLPEIGLGRAINDRIRRAAY